MRPSVLLVWIMFCPTDIRGFQTPNRAQMGLPYVYVYICSEQEEETCNIETTETITLSLIETFGWLDHRQHSLVYRAEDPSVCLIMFFMVLFAFSFRLSLLPLLLCNLLFYNVCYWPLWETSDFFFLCLTGWLSFT